MKTANFQQVGWYQHSTDWDLPEGKNIMLMGEAQDAMANDSKNNWQPVYVLISIEEP